MFNLLFFCYYFCLFFYSVIFFNIRYILININNIIIIITILIFLFFNDLKIGLKVVKKNPMITAIKNLGNLYTLLQKLYIIILL